MQHSGHPQCGGPVSLIQRVRYTKKKAPQSLKSLQENVEMHIPTFINIHQHSSTFINIHQHSSTFINIYQHSLTLSDTLTRIMHCLHIRLGTHGVSLHKIQESVNRFPAFGSSMMRPQSVPTKTKKKACG